MNREQFLRNCINAMKVSKVKSVPIRNDEFSFVQKTLKERDDKKEYEVTNHYGKLVLRYVGKPKANVLQFA